MAQISLLVEAGLVQAERVDDVENLLGGVLGALVCLLGGGIGADVYICLSADWRGMQALAVDAPMSPTPTEIFRQSAS